jgi:hypothetical protein
VVYTTDGCIARKKKNKTKRREKDVPLDEHSVVFCVCVNCSRLYAHMLDKVTVTLLVCISSLHWWLDSLIYETFSLAQIVRLGTAMAATPWGMSEYSTSVHDTPGPRLRLVGQCVARSAVRPLCSSCGAGDRFVQSCYVGIC